jgi:hypothetical protein
MWSRSRCCCGGWDDWLDEEGGSARFRGAGGHEEVLRHAERAGNAADGGGLVVGRRLPLLVSKDRKRAKALLWDGTGLCLYAKRLEKGRFTALWGKCGEAPVRLTVSELALFLEGSQLAGKVPLSPAPFVTGSFFTAKLPQPASSPL